MLTKAMLFAAVQLRPDGSAIPGSNVLQNLVNGLGFVALMLCLAGLVIGAGLWGVGGLSSNYQAATIGKRSTAYSLAGALVVGASVALVNWAFGLGTSAS